MSLKRLFNGIVLNSNRPTATLQHFPYRFRYLAISPTSQTAWRRSNMTSTSADGGGGLALKNVLDQSRSPYVRGHMNNPVAWQMWGPDAIALAKKHNRLLFVSIGYAACHWCHVMERESFENDEIAAVLNDSFIPIKVDREERMDVDRIYMQYVQATTGHGGWPLNVFLTPDLEPVWGGTYLPGPNSQMVKTGRHTGFLGLIQRLKQVWETEPDKCITSAKLITEKLREYAQEGTLSGPRISVAEDDDAVDLDLLEEAYQHYVMRFDREHAGFGGSPKFPTPAHLGFLILLGQFSTTVQDVVGSTECENARAMVIKTLRHMARGGIKDQVGHGFARYSVTRDWSLPHFEKMLYDQGQLLDVYLDAFLTTGDAEMLGGVYDISTYMTTPVLAAKHGGYFSSEDADSYYRTGDSEKREGAFYVWTMKEFRDILGEKDAEVCARFWNVKEHGNVAPEHDAHDELTNQNVLAIVSSPEALAKDFGLSKEDVVRIIKDGRAKLLEHRDKERPRPDLDDKIVVAWNGLAIGALARVSSALQSIDAGKAEECRNSAIRAVEFIKKELFDASSGVLKRIYREGPGDAPAFADDYAFLIRGLIELYEATFDDQYLELADTLQKTQNKLFWDSTGYGFFSTQAGQADMILRLKDGIDNAEPSTNGASAANLHRLGAMLDDESYTTMASQTVAAFSTELTQHPFLFSSMLSSVVAQRLGMRTIVICGDGEGVDEAVGKSRARLKPNTTVVRLGGGSAKSDWLVKRNKLLQAMDPTKARLQVCEGGVCKDELDMGQVDRVLALG